MYQLPKTSNLLKISRLIFLQLLFVYFMYLFISVLQFDVYLVILNNSPPLLSVLCHLSPVYHPHSSEVCYHVLFFCCTPSSSNSFLHRYNSINNLLFLSVRQDSFYIFQPTYSWLDKSYNVFILHNYFNLSSLYIANSQYFVFTDGNVYSSFDLILKYI